VSAVLEAARWIDASPENKRETAQILSRRAWLNTKEQYLTGRMLGEYDNGIGNAGRTRTRSASSTTGPSAIRITPTACGS
jgi:ABC-type nitrate/sulfonate/bicarbonate transport system substrate-binding protein